MNSKYLPIGSIVLLKTANKKIMITGYFVVSKEEPNTVYDYSGCMYPEGYVSFNEICLFNHNQIDKLYYIGYRNRDQQSFNNQLIALSSEK